MNMVSASQIPVRYGGESEQPVEFWPPSMSPGEIETPMVMSEGLDAFSTITAGSTSFIALNDLSVDLLDEDSIIMLPDEPHYGMYG